MTTHELEPTPTQIQVERIPGFGTAGWSTMPESYWGIAELQSFTRKPSGHCYLDLLESEQGREVAKVRATLFPSVAGKSRTVAAFDFLPALKGGDSYS